MRGSRRRGFGFGSLSSLLGRVRNLETTGYPVVCGRRRMKHDDLWTIATPGSYSMGCDMNLSSIVETQSSQVTTQQPVKASARESSAYHGISISSQQQAVEPMPNGGRQHRRVMMLARPRRFDSMRPSSEIRRPPVRYATWPVEESIQAGSPALAAFVTTRNFPNHTQLRRPRKRKKPSRPKPHHKTTTSHITRSKSPSHVLGAL